MTENIFNRVKSMCEVRNNGNILWVRKDKSLLDVVLEMMAETGVKYNVLDNITPCYHNETIFHCIIIAYLENDNIKMNSFYVEEKDDSYFYPKYNTENEVD